MPISAEILTSFKKIDEAYVDSLLQAEIAAVVDEVARASRYSCMNETVYPPAEVSSGRFFYQSKG